MIMHGWARRKRSAYQVVTFNEGWYPNVAVWWGEMSGFYVAIGIGGFGYSLSWSTGLGWKATRKPYLRHKR